MRAFVISIFLFFTLSVYSQDINRAHLAFAEQSSLASGGIPERAVDGNTNGQWGAASVTHTQSETNPWWQCDIGESADVKLINIWNRTDCCSDRLQNFYLFVSEESFGERSLQELLDDTNVWSVFQESMPNPNSDLVVNVAGRYIRVQLDNQTDTPLSLAEVEVWAADEGKSIQNIDFTAISKKRTDSQEFDLIAESDSGLPVIFSVIDGPASIVGGKVILDGVAGIVRILAEQKGDDTYYAAPPVKQEFEVVDPNSVVPTTRIVSLSEEYPIYMPEIRPIQLLANGNIDHADLFEISDFYFEIDGSRIEAIIENGLYTAWWAPTGYQTYTIQTKILGSNGVENVDQISIEIVQDTPDLLVGSFEKEHVSPGAQRITKTYNFPSQVGAFFDIIAILDITCPPGGCDPWDRLAWVEVRWPDGEWREIIRYITPFGVPCQHIIDVSEYTSILQGEVEFRVYISTWQAGFEVSLDFAFSAGAPPYPYSKLDVIWRGAYDFGNMANLQPLDTVQYSFHPKADKSDINVLISGHGWGDNNAENAAEFRYTRNYLHANENEFQHLVYNICDPNPDGCQPQLGTWRFSRSGWCPGAITHPIKINLDEYIGESDVELIYELDPLYVDWCHPNNPNCVSGMTCEDCNAGFNPHYYISANLVSYSQEPMTDNISSDVKEIITNSGLINIQPNPGKDLFQITVEEEFRPAYYHVYDLNGKLIQSNGFGTKSPKEFEIDLSLSAPGLYFLHLFSETAVIQSTIIKM